MKFQRIVGELLTDKNHCVNVYYPLSLIFALQPFELLYLPLKHFSFGDIA